MAWKPDYATTAELRVYLRLGDTVNDTQLDMAIAAASRAIDTACARQFGVVSVAEARYYTAFWDFRKCRWMVTIDDLMSTTNLVVQFDEDADQTYGGVLAAADYTLLPRNGAPIGVPWTELQVGIDADVDFTSLENGTKVTAIYGWTAVPTAVKQACLIQASRLFARRDSPYGVAGSAETGSELRLMARVDPDVEVVLRPYRRRWGAV